MAQKFNFSTYRQLEMYMENRLKKILNECAREAMEELKANIEENLYSWTPRKYERTRMFIDSVSKTKATKVGDRYECKIYYDTDKIRSIIRMPNSWNAHANFDNEWIGDELIYWLEYGTPDNPYYQHPEYGFVRETLEWLQTEYKKMFKDKARKYGVPIE